MDRPSPLVYNGYISQKLDQRLGYGGRHGGPRKPEVHPTKRRIASSARLLSLRNRHVIKWRGPNPVNAVPGKVQDIRYNC
jgi:hypothetical protein